jgi:hypothetical protein
MQAVLVPAVSRLGVEAFEILSVDGRARLAVPLERVDRDHWQRDDMGLAIGDTPLAGLLDGSVVGHFGPIGRLERPARMILERCRDGWWTALTLKTYRSVLQEGFLTGFGGYVGEWPTPGEAAHGVLSSIGSGGAP